MALVRFLFLLGIKVTGSLFFRFELTWVGGRRERNFDDIRLGILLNHTSLYEPLFIKIFSLSGLWRLATQGVFPGADKTMNRPIVGRFFKMLAPKPISITRKRDDTWSRFTDSIEADSLVILAAEGRMKRPHGLDLDGRPMTVRGGVADILEQLEGGRMLILYSGGLHHVQVPGQWLPKPFKTIRATLEVLPIDEYKALCQRAGGNFKAAVIADLQERRDHYCADCKGKQAVNA